MSWEKKPDGPESWVQRVEGALRHPDGPGCCEPGLVLLCMGLFSRFCVGVLL